MAYVSFADNLSVHLQALLDLQMNSDLKAQLHDLTFTGAKVICDLLPVSTGGHENVM